MGIRRRDDEKNQITLRNVVLSDRFMVLDNRVGSRRVDDGHFPQHFLWQIKSLPIWSQRCDSSFRSVNELLNTARAWPGCHFANLFPDQSIDETTLTHLDFTDDNKQGRRLKIR